MSFSLDLHVLGTPPAFVLSQDQTLNKNLLIVQINSDLVLLAFFALHFPLLPWFVF